MQHDGTDGTDRLRTDTHHAGLTSGEGLEQRPSSPPDTQPAAEQPASTEPAPLLATKLYRPRPRRQLVARPRLLARLDAGLSGSLTLVAAPAGFGKTMLLADWLNQPAAASRHIAWLALDATDNDPNRFLSYLVAALQGIAPAVGTSVLPLLRAAQPVPLDTVLPVLANDLGTLPDPSIVVLDDYHVIDAPAVHRAVLFLIEHLPPQLHLVIASRADPPFPLARWRARSELTQLRADDLRFTTEEAAAFLQQVMGISLTAAQVSALETRTEGWIAGLQLAALSLEDRPEAELSAFIEAFTGSHRFVVDYLVDDVLAGQPAHVQRFLLHTSILERLSGPLCDAVTELSNPGSQVQLEQLERANLFIVPLDEARRWYRYHHLFAQVLQERLASSASADTRTALHQRASAWFEQHGLIVEAMQHAIAAQDLERAARLIVLEGRFLMVRGQIHTLLGWYDAFPPAFLDTHPHLLVTYAAALFCLNQLEAAEERVTRAAEALSTNSGDELSRQFVGIAAGIRAHIAYFRGDLALWQRLSQDELLLLPTTELNSLLFARLNLAGSFLLTGDVGGAHEHQLVTTVTATRETKDLMTRFHGLMLLAELCRRAGRVQQALLTYAQAAELAPTFGGLQMLPNGAGYHFGMGAILYEQNELDAAEHHLRHGQRMAQDRLLVTAIALSQGYHALMRLQRAKGEYAAASAVVQEFVTLAAEHGYAPEIQARGAAMQAELALHGADPVPAYRWADVSALSLAGDLDYGREAEYLTLLRVRIAQAASDGSASLLTTVLDALDQLLDAAETGMRHESVMQILVLRALALAAQGQPAAAVENLARAVLLATPAGYVRSFVDEGPLLADVLSRAVRAGELPADARPHAGAILQILEAPGVAPASVPSAQSPGSATEPPDIEHLTERELEVLHLLASGRSNQAIADELIIAVGTVKRHVNGIMGKLQVQSRLEAVARARERGLIS